MELVYIFVIILLIFLVRAFFKDPSSGEKKKSITSYNTSNSQGSNEEDLLKDLRACRESRIRKHLKDGYFSFRIKGIFYRNKEQIEKARLLKPGDKLFLIKEPSNLYDRNAIKVQILADGTHIGYVPASSCEDVVRLIKLCTVYSVKVYVKKDEDGVPCIIAMIEFDESIGKKKPINI